MKLILNFKVEGSVVDNQALHSDNDNTFGLSRDDPPRAPGPITGYIQTTHIAVSSLDEKLISVKKLRFNGIALPNKGDLIYAEIADKEKINFMGEEYNIDEDFINSLNLSENYEDLTEIEKEEFFNSIYNNKFDKTKLDEKIGLGNLTDFEQAEFKKYVDKKDEEYRNSKEDKKELENKIIEACKALKTEEIAVEIGIYDPSTSIKSNGRLSPAQEERSFREIILEDNKKYSIGVVLDYKEAKRLAPAKYKSVDK